MKYIFYALYMIVQCTWGIGQTLIGLVLFFKNLKCPHSFYRGCIATEWDRPNSGISLGLFIFVPKSDDSMVKVHEYGHTYQSLVLGPLYLIPGMISIIWANLPYYRRLRREKNVPYTRCFVEKNASRIGERITGEKAV